MKNTAIRLTLLLLAATLLCSFISCSHQKQKKDESGTVTSGTEWQSGDVTDSNSTEHSETSDFFQTSDNASDTDSSWPERAELTWTADVVKDSYSYDGECLILNTINCPLLVGSEDYPVDAINSALRDYCKEYVKITSSDKAVAKDDYSASKMDMRDFELHEKSSDFTVYLRGDVISFLFHSYEASGGADSLWLYSALNFDLTTGEPLTLGEYLEKDEDYAKDYMIAAFTQIINANPSNFFDDALALLPNEISTNHFYLTKDGVTLFLNAYAISPSALGTQTVVIPYGNLPK